LSNSDPTPLVPALNYVAPVVHRLSNWRNSSVVSKVGVDCVKLFILYIPWRLFVISLCWYIYLGNR